MDGTKRKASASPPQDHENLSLDFTPPRTLPAFLEQESALRYTQTHASYPRHPVGLPPDLVTKSTDCGPWLALAHATEQEEQLTSPSQPQQSECDSFSADDMITDISSDGDDDASVHVDTDDGHDEVYIINAAISSWSGPLPSEVDPDAQIELPFQAILAIQHLKRAQGIAAKAQCDKAANAGMEALLPEQDGPLGEEASLMDSHWDEDLMLRTIIRRVKRALEKGATLTIHRLAFANALALYCSYPFCRQADRTIPTGAYYLTLKEPENCSAHYCLHCLEDLWNGKELRGLLPAAQVKSNEAQRQQNLVFSLDGEWIPQSLLSSKHAPAHFQVPRPRLSPARSPTPSPSTPHIASDTASASPPPQSPRSTTSAGQWLQAPTRFQHLAAFITAGESLSVAEKTAVEAWKAASEEQTGWIEFRTKYRRTVAELAGADADQTIEHACITPKCENQPARPRLGTAGSASERNGHLGTSSCVQWDEMHHDTDVDLDEAGSYLDSRAKLRAGKQCRGQNLSAVLARLFDT